MGIGSLIEAVIVCAVCAGLVRRELTVNTGAFSLVNVRPSEWFRVLVGALLLGLALCGGVGLAIETVRGRRPSTWGIGRWIWSVSSLFAFLSFVESLLRFAVAAMSRQTDRQPWLQTLGAAVHWAELTMTNHLPWPLTAVCATAMVTRVIRDPEPDTREYLGRLFATLIVASGIAWQLLMLTGR